MRQLQVTVPKKFKKDAKEILEKESSDISSSEVEKDSKKAVEFTVSVDSEDIDGLSEKLKDIEDLESGELSIRVLEQESLIRKGQKTRGSNSGLSQEEVYSKAQEASGFSRAQWGLIAVSSAIAAYGLAMDNIIVVVGAMMLAPLLSPFVSGAISLVAGDSTMMKESFVTGLKSVLLAVSVAFIAVIPFSVSMNPTLEMVVSSSILGVLLSLLVGAAAALSFSTGYRDQIAGVAVAIALVPPLASAGIGLKMYDMVFAVNAASMAVINILAVIVSGSVTFKFLGLSPATSQKQREAKKLRYVVPVALLILGLISAPVVYSSYQGYQDHLVEQQVLDSAEEYFGNDLLDVRFHGDTVTVLVIGSHELSEFEEEASQELNIDVRQLQAE